FALDYLAAAATTATHLSRLGAELVLWSTVEFGFCELSDAWSSGSSIMPQKKNPDAAELLRAKAPRILAHHAALHGVLHGLPLTYNKDMQEDKEHVFDTADTLALVLAAARGMLATVGFDRERLAQAASDELIAAVDVADLLVRSRLAVSSDQNLAVFYAVADHCDITDAHGRGTLRINHGVANLIERGELASGQNQVLQIIFRQFSDRRYQIRCFQPVRHVGKRQTVRDQFLRIDNHLNLARVAGLHFDNSHAGHAADQRLHDVKSLIAQVLAGYVTIQNQTENRKYCGAYPFNLHDGIGGEGRGRFVFAAPQKMQGVLAVRISIEKHGNFGRAARSFRPHAIHALHRHGGFFQRTRHRKQHHIRRQISGMNE